MGRAYRTNVEESIEDFGAKATKKETTRETHA
jgi:hypothetical protein